MPLDSEVDQHQFQPADVHDEFGQVLGDGDHHATRLGHVAQLPRRLLGDGGQRHRLQ